MVSEQQVRYPKGTYRLQITAGLDNKMLYRLTNLVSRRSYHGCSLWQMLRALDDDLTANHYPQRTVRYRAWEAGRQMKDIDTDGSFGEPAAGSPTFVIRVLFRQNATWQGSIQWLEGRQTRQFRSEYEMLKFMDEAMGLNALDVDKTQTSWETGGKHEPV